VDKIDWAASAKLSLARGTEEFVVREHYAEEAPRVVCLVDRRPSLGVFSPEWPWLQKPRALQECVRLISASAVAARGLLGYLDEADGTTTWLPPRGSHELRTVEAERPFHAPADTLVRGLSFLARQRRDLPAGSFLFCCSDYLAPPPREAWLRALERRWELVPVLVQDPVWEQSFPDVSGLVVPFLDVDGGRRTLASLTVEEVERRKHENESRYRELVRSLRALGLDPVLVSSHEPKDVLLSFLTWADERLFVRGAA
jgi:hypothetical protein